MHKKLVYQMLTAASLLACSTFADIVWSGEQNLSGYEHYIDLNSNSRTDVVLVYEIYGGDEFDPDSHTAILRAYIENDGTDQILVASSNGRDAALPYGTLISGTPDASLQWKGRINASGNVDGWDLNPPEPNTGWSGLLGESGEAYLGIAFDIEGSTHYGWVHVTLGEVNPEFGAEDPITASWAYESTPGVGIVAGAIPEPSTGLLTVGGSFALLMLARARRRR